MFDVCDRDCVWCMRGCLLCAVCCRALCVVVHDPGKPTMRFLEKEKANRKRKSQYEQDVSSKRGIAVVSQGSSSQESSEAAVGASCAAATCRQEQVNRMRGEFEIPYTPQYIADWLYQSPLDTVRRAHI